MAQPMFSLLFCVAVLLAECEGLKCKIEMDDNEGVLSGPSTECKAGAEHCFAAECTAAGSDKSKPTFLWGCLGVNNAKKCEIILEDDLGEVEAKNAALGKWTCTCFVGKAGKDMDNERFGGSYNPDTRRLEMLDNESTENKLIRDVKNQVSKLEEALRKLDRVKTK